MANSTGVRRSFIAETKSPFELHLGCCAGWREQFNRLRQKPAQGSTKPAAFPRNVEH